MLTVGERAPEFSLPNHASEQVSLASLLERGPLVVYFYPADFTPGCTKEACSLRDLHAELVDAGLQVVGISPQAPQSHARFRQRHQLPFELLADTDKRVIRAWGVDGPLGLGVRRATFLVGRDGIIADALVADLRIGRHEDFVRRAIDVHRRC